MPDGSSSAAPVIRPGPRSAKNFRNGALGLIYFYKYAESVAPVFDAAEIRTRSKLNLQHSNRFNSPGGNIKRARWTVAALAVGVFLYGLLLHRHKGHSAAMFLGIRTLLAVILA